MRLIKIGPLAHDLPILDEDGHSIGQCVVVPEQTLRNDRPSVDLGNARHLRTRSSKVLVLGRDPVGTQENINRAHAPCKQRKRRRADHEIRPLKWHLQRQQWLPLELSLALQKHVGRLDRVGFFLGWVRPGDHAHAQTLTRQLNKQFVFGFTARSCNSRI